MLEAKADLSPQNLDQEKAGFLSVLKARETLPRTKQSAASVQTGEAVFQVKNPHKLCSWETGPQGSPVLG